MKKVWNNNSNVKLKTEIMTDYTKELTYEHIHTAI
jgi:hypothetical protein